MGTVKLLVKDTTVDIFNKAEGRRDSSQVQDLEP